MSTMSKYIKSRKHAFKNLHNSSQSLTDKPISDKLLFFVFFFLVCFLFVCFFVTTFSILGFQVRNHVCQKPGSTLRYANA